MALRAALASCVLILALHDVQGMQCQRKQVGGETGIVSKLEDLVINCPRPVIDGESESFCCYSDNYSSFNCCNFSDFIVSPLFLFYCSIVFCLIVALLTICCVIKFFALLLDMCCGIVNYLHRKL